MTHLYHYFVSNLFRWFFFFGRFHSRDPSKHLCAVTKNRNVITFRPHFMWPRPIQATISRRHTIFEIPDSNRQINNTYAHHSIGLIVTAVVLEMTKALIDQCERKPVANSISIRTLFLGERIERLHVFQVGWHICELEPHTWALNRSMAIGYTHF